MSGKNKKILYVSIVGFLTCTAASAAYWQTKRYIQARARWDLISKQFSKKEPDSLAHLKSVEKFPLKYVQVHGSLSQKAMLISRAREGRMGHLIVRAIQFANEEGNKEFVLAVQGWIPQDYKYNPKPQARRFVGILRQKQRSDYLHQRIKAKDLEKFSVNTFIDVEKAIDELQLDKSKVNGDYYLEILKGLEHSEQNHYPYQYSVDNFQLPYLTPDKHRAYAMFWSLTTMVGLGAITRVLRMK